VSSPPRAQAGPGKQLPTWAKTEPSSDCALTRGASPRPGHNLGLGRESGHWALPPASPAKRQAILTVHLNPTAALLSRGNKTLGRTHSPETLAHSLSFIADSIGLSGRRRR
jgi:hypothetical protein